MSRVCEDVEKDGLEICKKINRKSLIAVEKAKECVKKAYNLSLSDGLEYEKRIFWASFATNDRKEGMDAFVEKRKPEWTDNWE